MASSDPGRSSIQGRMSTGFADEGIIAHAEFDTIVARPWRASLSPRPLPSSSVAPQARTAERERPEERNKT